LGLQIYKRIPKSLPEDLVYLKRQFEMLVCRSSYDFFRLFFSSLISSCSIFISSSLLMIVDLFFRFHAAYSQNRLHPLISECSYDLAAFIAQRHFGGIHIIHPAVGQNFFLDLVHYGLAGPDDLLLVS